MTLEVGQACKNSLACCAGESSKVRVHPPMLHLEVLSREGSIASEAVTNEARMASAHGCRHHRSISGRWMSNHDDHIPESPKGVASAAQTAASASATCDALGRSYDKFSQDQLATRHKLSSIGMSPTKR